ncbi:hypothetical protein PT974_11895 [Cladobotryum mycophilum]|uniref:Uncharacterized protein n=1 Tax=Cladobotryum mycophilum TaxID=491253 RepID=A0ABR0S6K4_9HYPO
MGTQSRAGDEGILKHHSQFPLVDSDIVMHLRVSGTLFQRKKRRM